jgi:hypothetical protein
MGNTYYEMMIGLYERREIEIEDISQARERFLNTFNENSQAKGKTMLTIRQDREKKINDDEVVDETETTEDGMTLEQRYYLYSYELGMIKQEDRKERRKAREYED